MTTIPMSQPNPFDLPAGSGVEIVGWIKILAGGAERSSGGTIT